MLWNTFDQFKRRNFAVWVATLSNDGENGKIESEHDQISLSLFARI
jgi:hypothetical protein